MKPERWQQIEQLYHAALERASDERAAFLDQACDGDHTVRQEVESLLAYDEPAQHFIANPPDAIAADLLAAEQAPSPVGSSLGPYQVLALLGRGGMGEVYRARDDRLGREVAIKLLPAAFSTDRERLRRFEQEARAAGMLNHPNVLTIYDIGTHAGAPFIVSELLAGETLRERLRGEALPQRRVVDYALQIARGLQAAHEKGIVHRDLKPENLFITKDGRVKILDFGLAKLKPTPTGPLAGVDTQASTQPLGTAPGVVMGTVGYMAPEQVRAEEVDQRADIFAFGAILYELLSGRRAFQGRTAVEVLNAILKEEPPELAASGREVPASLERVVKHCLEKDPAGRFQSIGDVAFCLNWLDGAADSISASQSQAAILTKSYGRLGWIAAAAMLLVASTLFILYSQSRRPSGSLPAQATIKQLTSYTGTETEGALSPDGRHFAFVSEKGGAPDIWVRQVSGGDPLRITNDEAIESDLTYTPDGENIYYVSQGAIWRVGALGGTPRKVVQDARAPSLSADGKRLSYVKSIPGNRGAIEIANADGSASRRLYEDLGISDAKLSPDSRWVAYSSGGLFAPRPLKLIDVRSGEARIISSHVEDQILYLAWLPDSRRLVVSRTYGSGTFQTPLEIELVSIDGDEPRRLTLGVNTQFRSPSLSADGERLLLTMSQHQREIWTVPLGPDPKVNGTNAKLLLDSGWDPLWTSVSRDGGTILFNGRATGSSNLWTMPADASAPSRQITTFSGKTVAHSSLSPDGTRIAYASNQTGNSEIWIMNIDGSNPVQLTHDPAEDFWPFWSPDGSWLAFGSLRGGEYRVWKVPVSGGQAVRVSDEPAVRGDWIGDRLILSGGRSLAIVIVEAGTGKVLRKIGEPGQGLVGLPVWSPDGRRFTALRRDNYLKDSIWIFDADTGQGRLAVEFPGRFHVLFRAAWGKDAKSLIVNRVETISHICLIENFLPDDSRPYPE
jgi:serine/threonine protein kinase